MNAPHSVQVPVSASAPSPVADTVPAPSSDTYVVVKFSCISKRNMYAPRIRVFYNREDAYKFYDNVKDDIKYMREAWNIGYDCYNHSDDECVIQWGQGRGQGEEGTANSPIGVIIKRFTNPLRYPYVVVKFSCSGYDNMNPPNISLFYNRDNAYSLYNEVKGEILHMKEDKSSNIDYQIFDDYEPHEDPDTECIIQWGGERGTKMPIGVMITKDE